MWWGYLCTSPGQTPASRLILAALLIPCARMDTELWKQERQIWDVSREVTMAIEADVPAACEVAAREWVDENLPRLARTALREPSSQSVEEGPGYKSTSAGEVDLAETLHWRTSHP